MPLAIPSSLNDDAVEEIRGPGPALKSEPIRVVADKIFPFSSNPIAIAGVPRKKSLWRARKNPARSFCLRL